MRKQGLRAAGKGGVSGRSDLGQQFASAFLVTDLLTGEREIDLGLERNLLWAGDSASAGISIRDADTR